MIQRVVERMFAANGKMTSAPQTAQPRLRTGIPPGPLPHPKRPDGATYVSSRLPADSPTEGLPRRAEGEGCWVARHYDNSAIAIFADELSALRWAFERNASYCEFVEWGTEL